MALVLAGSNQCPALPAAGHVSGTGPPAGQICTFPCWFPSLGSLPASFSPARPLGPSMLNLHPVEPSGPGRGLPFPSPPGGWVSFLSGTARDRLCPHFVSSLLSAEPGALARARWVPDHLGTQSSGKGSKRAHSQSAGKLNRNVSLQPTPCSQSVVLDPRPLAALSPACGSVPLASDRQPWCRRWAGGKTSSSCHRGSSRTAVARLRV